MKTAIVHARLEPQTKREAEDVLHKLGISPTEAIRIFYRLISLHGGLPFAVEIPNARTTETLAKSRKGKEVEEFGSLAEMFESWEK